MVAQEVDRRERQLVKRRVRELLMVRHQLSLIVHPVRQVEEQPVLQRAGRALPRTLLGLLVHLHPLEAARHEHVDH